MTIRVLPDDLFTDNPSQHDHREQLSALMDGELEADQARFLLRRIGHDEALAACQESWQLMGDVLRGQASAPAPADFRVQVQHALDNEIAHHQSKHLRWKSWGAAALAASIAAVSVLLVTQTSFLAKPSLVETAPMTSATIAIHNSPTHTQPQALTLQTEIPSSSAIPIDPFTLIPEPVAKPWPRSTQPAASATYNTRALSETEAFYPFTPTLWPDSISSP